MRVLNPTRKQKILMASCGLKPENWQVERETYDCLYIISRRGKRRRIDKKEFVSRREKY